MTCRLLHYIMYTYYNVKRGFKMKLLIVGSRSISDIDISEYISEKAELIISGGASGVDTVAEEYADKNKISKLILRPQYELYRRAAPLKRNDLMVDICDNIIVFWDGKSKGTKHTIDYARKKGKPLTIVKIEQ